jgi:hypothetical protein
VSGEKFKELYYSERPFGNHWRYEGAKKSRHYLGHYVIPDNQSTHIITETVWSFLSELPDDFPDSPQPELDRGLSLEFINGIKESLLARHSRNHGIEPPINTNGH